MVRIEKDKLIIEVNCENQNPMQLLSEYQFGMLGAIHAYSHLDTGALPSNPNSSFSLQMSLHRLTRLFKEMLLNPDQSEQVGRAIVSEEQTLAEVNKWGIFGDH